jgi:hypothetical protein
VLGIRFVMQCANEGATPINLMVARDLKWSIVSQVGRNLCSISSRHRLRSRPLSDTQDDFAARNSWKIGERLILNLEPVSASNNRFFPSGESARIFVDRTSFARGAEAV